MVAMSKFLSVVSGRALRGLDGCRKDRGRSDRTPKGLKRRGGRPGAALLLREECERSSQGKKVADGRCGRTIEAKPVSDQTCLIEPAEDVAYDSGGRYLDMPALVSALSCRNVAAANPLPCL
ncbi:hypothetical protein DXT94_29650 [Rhizobium sp. ICMP 5592]|nr:hypothetical protein [Rhizobium sp. ICMP 5592]